MAGTIKLTEAQKARILALVESQPDAFQFCLGELAGDSVLVEGAKRSERELADHRTEMTRPVSRRDESYLLQPNQREECEDAIAAYEAVTEASRIIERAMTASEPALAAAE